MSKEQALQVIEELVKALVGAKQSLLSYQEMNMVVRALEVLKAPAEVPSAPEEVKGE